MFKSRLQKVSIAVGVCIVAGTLAAGCAGPNGGGTYGVTAAGSSSCKQMRHRMNKLLRQGRQESREYAVVLDRYLGSGCAG